MLTHEEAAYRLRLLFQRRKVVSLTNLMEVLSTASRATVYRHLSRAYPDYLTSYSHSGRYYTIRGNARFDETGLWRRFDVRFSRWGTLLSTVTQLVEDSEAGMTRQELEGLVGLTLAPSLSTLVRQHRIRRQEMLLPFWRVQAAWTVRGGPRRLMAIFSGHRRGVQPPFVARPVVVIERMSVYLSSDSEIGHRQADSRDTALLSGELPSEAGTIQVLLALIRYPASSTAELAEILRKEGNAISHSQIAAVIRNYFFPKRKSSAVASNPCLPAPSASAMSTSSGAPK